MSKAKRNYRLTKEKYLSEAEQQILIRTLKRNAPLDVRKSRNSILIYTALYTGGRASELLNLRVEDLDCDEETVFIRGLKGSDDRAIPVPEWLFTMLLRLANKSTDGRLFPISYQRLHQIWNDYRPVPKKFHSLRHSFAINLYKRTKDIRLLQVALGHRDWKNTMIYAEYQYKKEELRRIVA